MEFLFGSKAESGTYVVKPSRTLLDQGTGLVTHTVPLRIKFKQHKWNSKVAQSNGEFKQYAEDYKITEDEVRKLCEKHLKEHQDFGRVDGRGVFVNDSAMFVKTVDGVEVGGKFVRICTASDDMGEDGIVPCDKPCAGEGEFCERHEALIAAVGG